MIPRYCKDLRHFSRKFIAVKKTELMQMRKGTINAIRYNKTNAASSSYWSEAGFKHKGPGTSPFSIHSADYLWIQDFSGVFSQCSISKSEDSHCPKISRFGLIPALGLGARQHTTCFSLPPNKSRICPQSIFLVYNLQLSIKTEVYGCYRKY